MFPRGLLAVPCFSFNEKILLSPDKNKKNAVPCFCCIKARQRLLSFSLGGCLFVFSNCNWVKANKTALFETDLWNIRLEIQVIQLHFKMYKSIFHCTVIFLHKLSFFYTSLKGKVIFKSLKMTALYLSERRTLNLLANFCHWATEIVAVTMFPKLH